MTAWADQSGAGNGATAATNPPVAGLDSDGRPIVQFFTDPTAANGDTMTVAPAVTFDARNLSVFVAARLASSGNSAVFSLSNYAGNASHMRFTASAAGTQLLHALSRNSGLAPHMQKTVLSTVSGSTIDLGMDSDLTTGFAAATADVDCLGAQISGNGTGSLQAMDVYEVLVYNRAVSSGEAAANRSYLTAKYGVRTGPWTKVFATEGDSITQGTGTIQHRGYPWMIHRAGLESWRQTNLGTSGATLASLTARGAATDGVIRAGARNVLLVQIGRNDVSSLTAQQMYDALVTYVQARVTAGWEVWVGTMIATGGAGSQAKIDDYNATIRAGIVAAGAARVVDFASIPQFSSTANTSDTTYYQGDSTHPTAVGAKLLADMVAAQLAAA